MRNCLIMGCGRSGTSMLAGILHQAGYFMGDKLYSPNPSNPKGFFEWMKITHINEDLLSAYSQSNQWLKKIIHKRLFNKKSIWSPGKNQHWLYSFKKNISIDDISPEIERRIREVTKREPYCYKDPRFSYTFPIWRQYMDPSTGFICIFREPSITIQSMLKECRSREYLVDFTLKPKHAYLVWSSIYSYILSRMKTLKNCMFFIHYNQIVQMDTLPKLSDFLGANLSGDHIEPTLNRTVAENKIPGYVNKIYNKLCQLANY